FRDTVLGADYFHEALIGKLLAACRAMVSPPNPPSGGVEINPVADLIQETQALVSEVRATLEKGRDRLLEINSNKSELARGLIAEIRAEDQNTALEEYLVDVFD